MTDMPRLSTVTELEGPAERAHQAVVNGPRLRILRLLLQRGPMTRPEIAVELGISVSKAADAIRELEALGYVATDAPNGSGRRRVPYTADRSRLTADLFDFMGWLLG